MFKFQSLIGIIRYCDAVKMSSALACLVSIPDRDYKVLRQQDKKVTVRKDPKVSIPDRDYKVLRHQNHP